MLRVALIGAGGMGGVHLKIYEELEEVELVAVVELDPEKARNKLKNSGTRIYSSIETMLEREEVDMVDVCTPSYLHGQHAMYAMNRGIHVLCEKPMALTSAEAMEMADCAKKNGVLFMVAHVIRFWPEYRYLKKIKEDGSLGRFCFGNFSRLSEKPDWSWDDWMLDEKKSGRVIMDLHIHDADFVFSLLGMPVNASGHLQDDGVGLSHITATYEYEDAFVTAEGAWYDSPYPFSMNYRAVFENGVLEYKDNKLFVYEKDQKPVQIETESLIEEETGINVGSVSGYQNEIEYFLQCIRTNTKPSVIIPEESVECIRLLEELRENACKKGRRES